MSNRYQQLTYASGAMAPGAVLNTNTTGLPSLFNIVKVKVVPDAGGGTFDFRVYKADTFDPTKLLDHWDDVPGVSLFEPADNATGTLLEALEGYPFPYDDDDNSGEFHSQLINNDTASHSYTVTVWYEEVPKFGAAGGATFRAGIFVGDGSAIASSISFASAPGIGFYMGGSALQFISGGTRSFYLAADGVHADAIFLDTTNNDAIIQRFAANTAGMKNGSATNEWRFYGSSIVYGFVHHDGGATRIGSSGDFPVRLQANGTDRWGFTASSGAYALLPVADNSYDIGQATTRVRSVNAGTSINIIGVGGVGTALGTFYDGSSPSSTPFTTPRFVVYNDNGNWSYFSYGSDAITRFVVSKTATGAPLIIGASDANDGSGTFTPWVSIGPNGSIHRNDGLVAWTNSTNPAGTIDLALVRDAANTLALKNGTVAQAFRVYGTTSGSKYIETYHDGSNGSIKGTAGALSIYTVVDDTLAFGVNNASRWAISNSSNAYMFYPAVDNSYDAGRSDLRIRTGYFGTSVAIGTNPAAAGLVRLSNNDGVVWRNSTNTGEAAALYCDSGNNVTLDGTAGAGIYLNVSAKDTNVIVRSASNNSHFVSDAGSFGNVGAFGFGAVANGASFFAIDPPAIAAAANSNYARVYVGNAGAVTIPVGTAGIVASIYVEEPNVIATGTVTDAYSIAILAAPTEAGRNGGLWNKAVTRLDDFLEWRNSSGVLAVNEYASTKTLTDNVATDLFTVANSADGDFSGVTIEYAIMVDSGGNIQVESGFATIAIYNNGGTQNAQIVKVGTPAAVASTGTLTVTFSSTNVGGGRKVQVTADSSLNFDSTIRYKIVNHSAKAITIN